VDHVKNKFPEEEVGIAYVYCDYKDQEEQTSSSLIACLAKRLAARKEHLPQQSVNLYEKLTEKSEKIRSNLEELKVLLLSLGGSYKKLFVLVDALDECYIRREREAFLSALQALRVLQKTSVRTFVTSRPFAQDIQRAFKNSPQVEIKATESDVRKFVRNEIENDPDLIDLIMPELKENIISTIAFRACGMCVMIAASLFLTYY